GAGSLCRTATSKRDPTHFVKDRTSKSPELGVERPPTTADDAGPTGIRTWGRRLRLRELLTSIDRCVRCRVIITSVQQWRGESGTRNDRGRGSASSIRPAKTVAGAPATHRFLNFAPRLLGPGQAVVPASGASTLYFEGTASTFTRWRHHGMIAAVRRFFIVALLASILLGPLMWLVWTWTTYNGLPTFIDNGETYLSYMHAQSLQRYPISETWLVTIEDANLA